MLVEVCNLNNPDDRRLLQTRRYREKVAEALVAALVEFYGGKYGDPRHREVLGQPALRGACQPRYTSPDFF